MGLPVQTMVKRSQQAKMNSAIAVIAMQIAKKSNDINWQKAARAKKLLVASRGKILSKYGMQAKQEYMKDLGSKK